MTCFLTGSNACKFCLLLIENTSSSCLVAVAVVCNGIMMLLCKQHTPSEYVYVKIEAHNMGVVCKDVAQGQAL